MLGAAAQVYRDGEGRLLPREVEVPPLGRLWIRPLPLGDVRRFQRAPRSHAVLAQLFRRTLVGCGARHLTAADIRRFPPSVLALLEEAVFVASGLTPADEAFDDETADTPEGDAGAHDAGDGGVDEGDDDEPGRGSFFADPEEVEAQRQQARAQEVSIGEWYYVLHDYGYQYPEIAGLTLPEIELLAEGAASVSERSAAGETSGADTRDRTPARGAATTPASLATALEPADEEAT